jgi:DNA helicase HerA-like ATPase
MSDPLLIARIGAVALHLLPALANRHGLVTGATGTGKTVTLQVLAERFSSIGVPVFVSDVKGDLTGISQPGTLSPKLAARLAQHGLREPVLGGLPTTLWDVHGEKGHPLRATVSDMGPMLLGLARPVHVVTPSITARGILNVTALAVLEAAAAGG